MSRNLRKFFFLTTLSTLTLPYLNADSHNGSTTNANTSSKQKCYDFSLDAAALLWKVESEGSEFAASRADRHVDTLESGWDWGFRVGLAYHLPHDKWNIRLGWDHLRAGAADTARIGWWPFGHLAGSDTSYVNGNPNNMRWEQPVGSHWHLDYDTLDLALKKGFQFSKWLCVAPHIGLRTAWIYQDQHFTFWKNTSNQTETKAKNHFWGLGIRAGFDTEWGLGRGWSIFGNAATALLYGNYKVSSSVIQGDYTDPLFGNWRGSNSFHASRAYGEWTLGLRWNHMYSGERYGLTLQAAFEELVYWNMFESTVPGANAHEGNLSLTGWTFAAKFDF